MDRPTAPDTRGRILQTALDLFAAHGYQRTSLRAIADQLGLTKAAILYHFPSKEDLLLALIEPLLSDLEAAVARAARLPWPAARWAALEGWLDTLLTHRRPLGMVFNDLSVIRHGSTLTRMMRIARDAYNLVAGPGATRIEQIRAVQATAMLGDPIVFFADVPVEELRVELLDGVARLLGEAPPDGVAGIDGELPPRSRPPLAAGRDERRTGSDKVAGPDGPDETAAGQRLAPAGAPPATASERGTRGRRRGVGRPRAMSGEQIRTARALHATGSHTVEQIAARLGVSRATVYRHLKPTDRSTDAIFETDFETN
ncbi:TetR family transcriptional regulator [Micromonospora sp. HM5-17]|jgi:AcrR family transcriptional regulator|uniref:TetR family transcriptional regulator n=1 Tax=Micromonospora sp. HM5-17 TaxID=2487710 RepID=UPI0013151027|nr:TetR family transcriptional regulator [Micromonospora sp. HM5-17]